MHYQSYKRKQQEEILLENPNIEDYVNTITIGRKIFWGNGPKYIVQLEDEMLYLYFVSPVAQ